MKAFDDSKFDVEYREGPNGQFEGFESVIKADAPSASKMATEIYLDLDPEGHGISWWVGYKEFGEKRRIFVGDYLWQTAVSISTNLAEARLHILYLQEALEKSQEQVKRTIKVAPDGQTLTALPTKNTVRDELPSRLVGLHTAGLFRAMGSVLDCLAALMIGVVGIPTNVKRADFSRLLKRIDSIVDTSKLKAGDEIFDFRQKLNEILLKSGPENWLSWIASYRNVIVHRARRTEFIMLLGKHSGIITPNGHPVVTASEIPLLVKDPENTDVEGWVKFSEGTLLSEKSMDTLQGSFQSVRNFCEEISTELLVIWKRRRENPNLIVQPNQQWEVSDSSGSWFFKGFNSGSIALSADEIRSNGSTVHRMRSAAVDDKNFKKWEKFT